jgi:hypothetical protein
VNAVETAGYVLIPVVLAVGGFAYWFGGKIAKAGKDGMREQNTALKDQNDALRERVALAKEKEGAVEAKLSIATRELGALRTAVSGLSVSLPQRQLIDSSTASVAASIYDASTANNELRIILAGDPAQGIYQYVTHAGVTDPPPLLTQAEIDKALGKKT